MDCRVYAATGDPWLMMGGSGSGGGGQMLGGAFSHESEHDLAATATSWRTEVVVVAIQGATATAIPVSANLPTSPTRLRSLPALVNDHLGVVGDNEGNSSGFGGERLVDHTALASKESNDGGDNGDSDAESSTCGRQIGVDGLIRSKDSSVFESGVDGLMPLDESDRLHQFVTNKFVSRMEVFGVNAQVEHICRNHFNANAITHARLQTFLIYAEAMKIKMGGRATMRYAWFGASKDDIINIIRHGFSHVNMEKEGAFGSGLYLCTQDFPIETVKSSTVDDEGMRHILLCRVLSGEMEVVKPGSKQCHPSSVEFQTGVDNLKCPRKLIVWSAQLNTHILPEFVISFKTLSASSGPQINRVPCDASSTPLMSIKELISELSKVLPPEVTKKIEEYHRLCTEHKISRRDMVQGFRDSAGDELLRTVVKDLTERHQLKQYK